MRASDHPSGPRRTRTLPKTPVLATEHAAIPARRRRSRAIIVHTIDHARAALGAAAELGVTVTLLSPPGAAGYAGIGYFHKTIELAAAEHPNVAFSAILDCAAEAGRVLAAFRRGVKCVRFHGAATVAVKLAAIGAQSGATLASRTPRALDLRWVEDPAAACRAWLAA
ncbi:MAG: hypothetical protein EXQ89_02395 [Rhodospirillaceae bacterium]|nr:hypothetical protein [Rhodospirillaceae bacterium]